MLPNASKELPKPQQIMDLWIRHQYGMLFNHQGQVISGLKNMDLFLSIDLPKVEDIAHVPPSFPDCDNWATHIEQIGINMCATQLWDLEETIVDPSQNSTATQVNTLLRQST